MSVDLSNETASEAPFCTHQIPLHRCPEATCRQVLRLYQEQIEENRQETALSKKAKRPRKERKETEGEIRLEEEALQDWENTEKGGGYVYRSGLPFNRQTVRAMFQYGALTVRQARTAEIFLELREENKRREERNEPTLTRAQIWARVAADLGSSTRTVRRQFKRAKETLSAKPKANVPQYAPGSVLIERVRGERTPRYYLVRRYAFRNWQRTEFKRVFDRASIRKLLKDPLREKHHSSSIPIHRGPMNRLFGDLIQHFASDLPKHKTLPPTSFGRADWNHNVRHARRILESKNHRPGPWTASEVYQKLGLGHGWKLCKGCGSLILRGFRINGELITRRREFCDDACKMVSKRRAKKEN